MLLMFLWCQAEEQAEEHAEEHTLTSCLEERTRLPPQVTGKLHLPDAAHVFVVSGGRAG
jgi:hypothetical protein